MTLGSPPPGWPQPPYRQRGGAFSDLLDRDGYVVVPNAGGSRLVVEWLVREQALRRLAVRRVLGEGGAELLLVCDPAVWVCPEEEMR